MYKYHKAMTQDAPTSLGAFLIAKKTFTRLSERNAIELRKDFERFDKILSRHVPINRIPDVAARSKPPLGVNAQIRKLFDQRFDQMNRFRPQSAGHTDTHLRKTIFNHCHERSQPFGIHTQPSSHALVEQNTMDNALVITKLLNNFLRIIADRFERVLANLEDDFN